MYRMISVIAKDADMHRKDEKSAYIWQVVFNCEISDDVYLFFIFFHISEDFYDDCYNQKQTKVTHGFLHFLWFSHEKWDIGKDNFETVSEQVFRQ